MLLDACEEDEGVEELADLVGGLFGQAVVGRLTRACLIVCGQPGLVGRQHDGCLAFRWQHRRWGFKLRVG